MPASVRWVEPAYEPLVSAGRTLAPIWMQTFTRSGFRVSVDKVPPSRYTLRHMAEPSIDQRLRPYWGRMGSGQTCSQIPGWSAFGKAHLVKFSREGGGWAPFGFALPNETDLAKKFA